jgi:Transposase DDE domain
VAREGHEGEAHPIHGDRHGGEMGQEQDEGMADGYKLHLSCSTGSLAVPLSAGFTTANVSDNQMYSRVTSSLRGVRYVDADEGYDDSNLYALSREGGFELVCPIERYASTPPERVELVQFYESELGQAVYSWRMRSIEPLIEHIKDVFEIGPLPVRGLAKASSIVFVLLYQLIVYYNHKTGRPLKALKHMLDS